MAEEASNGVVAAVLKTLSRSRVQVALIILVGVLAYSNTFHVPFLLDDETSITDNPVIRHLGRFLTGEGYSYGGNYNPRRFVGYLTLALNYSYGGLDVTGYHVVNLAIHLVSALLVYALVRLTLATPFFKQGLGARGWGLGEPGAVPEAEVNGQGAPVALSVEDNTGDWSGAQSHEKGMTQKAGEAPLLAPSPQSLIPLLAALLFVAHPVQTQAVTYIVQRLASLCTMFYLGSLVCYAQARLLHEGQKRAVAIPFYALSLAAALLAMWTKEIAATLPLVIGVFEFSFFTSNRRRKLMVILPVLALLAVIVPLGLMHAGKPLGEVLSDVSALTRETTTISRGEYLVTQFAVIVTYLRLLVLPVGQNLDYDYPVYRSLWQARPLGSLMVLTALAALAGWCYRKSSRDKQAGAGEGALLRLTGFGILWFFITLTVESSVIPIRDVIFEHRLYLPSVGAFLALASLLAALSVRLPKRREALTVASLAAVAVLALVSFARNEVWRSDLSLWQDVVDKSPGRSRPHHNLARAYEQHGILAGAEREYLAALKLDPTNSESYTNLGVVYRREGRLAEAVEAQRRAMRYGEQNPSPRLNLGVLLASQQRYREAEYLFREALRLQPRYGEAHLNLALLYGLEGDLVRAEQEYRETLKFDPLNAQALDGLGMICLKEGRLAESESCLRRAVSLMPQNPVYSADLSKLVSLNRAR